MFSLLQAKSRRFYTWSSADDGTEALFHSSFNSTSALLNRYLYDWLASRFARDALLIVENNFVGLGETWRLNPADEKLCYF